MIWVRGFASRYKRWERVHSGTRFVLGDGFAFRYKRWEQDAIRELEQMKKVLFIAISGGNPILPS